MANADLVPDPCRDGQLSRDESDVDCGGMYCPPCTLGKLCAGGADCETGLCRKGTCDEPFAGVLGSPAPAEVWQVRLGDVDGDGKLDAVFLAATSGRANGQLVVVRGRGDGTFAGVSTMDLGRQPQALLVADLTGDGRADAAVACGPGMSGKLGDPAPGLLVGFGQADGSFDTPRVLDGGDNPWRVVALDANGDGRRDLAVYSYKDALEVRVYLNQGNGALVKSSELPGHSGSSTFLTGDLDDDGHADLLAAGGSSAAYLGRGDGTFGTALPANTNSAGSFTLLDWSGDGKLDLLSADPGAYGGGSLGVARGVGDGTFAGATRVTTTRSGIPAELHNLDVDGDGRLEAVGAGSLGMGILYVDAGGTIRLGIQEITDGGSAVRGTSVDVGDLDGDGRADLLVASAGGKSSNRLFALRVNAP